jgi:predicted flap endonuclease-1-like 5' DNA nuclease
LEYIGIKGGEFTMPKLSFVEGIGPAYEEKLNALGIKTTEKFFELAATKKGRKELAEKSGISEKLILEWTNMIDLYRIKGVGSEYADLLEEAGVDTVAELAGRRADNLLKKMEEVNAQKKLVRLLPSLKMVEKWVEQAKSLPRGIEY